MNQAELRGENHMDDSSSHCACRGEKMNGEIAFWLICYVLIFAIGLVAGLNMGLILGLILAKGG